MPRPPATCLNVALAGILALVASATAPAQEIPRARDLGIPFDGEPGPLNAITDVPGVEVGHATLIRGEGRRIAGEGPVRTGVTAIFPRGRDGVATDVFGGWHTLNGNGEMTGTTWLEESGFLGGPILLTNTLSIGAVHEAVIDWTNRRGSIAALPVVAETWDGTLNDIDGFHVRKEHAFAAMDSARGGLVAEGNVGGGTGMVCHGYKGGIGTSSRRLPDDQGGWTVGVLVQCNYGNPFELTIAGIPVGRELGPSLLPCHLGADPPTHPWLEGMPSCADRERRDGGASAQPFESGFGSIIVVIATDAPLLPHQLERLAQRATIGIAKMGGKGEDPSGDIFVAFSTAELGEAAADGSIVTRRIANESITPLFYAVARATEEAIVNAMVAAETMVGADDVRVSELPVDRVRELLREHDRLME
jgi:L-aminopeptidase/D-esterase-like protein